MTHSLTPEQQERHSFANTGVKTSPYIEWDLMWQLVSIPVIQKTTKLKVLVQLLPEAHCCNQHNFSSRQPFIARVNIVGIGMCSRQGFQTFFFFFFFFTATPRSVSWVLHSGSQHFVPYTKSENGYCAKSLKL